MSRCEKFVDGLPTYDQYLCTIGEMSSVKDNGLNLKNKLRRDRGLMAMFVGYTNNHFRHMYIFVNMRSKKTMLSRNVT